MALLLFPPLYIFLSTMLFAKAKWTAKLAVGALILLATSKNLLYKLCGASWFTSPDCLPRPVLHAAALLYIVAVIFLCLLILTDAIQLLPAVACLAFRRKLMPRIRDFRKYLHLALLAAAVAMGAIGFANAMKLPTVRRIAFQRPASEQKLQDTTIAFITDLHADPFFPDGRIQSFVDATNGLHPDFVLIGGDCVDGTPQQRPQFLAPLAKLTPKVATLAIPGNHEYLSGYDAWKPILEQYGIEWLDNRHRDFPDHGLAVCGVTDAAASRQGLPPPDLAAATAGCPKGCTRILLAHRPSLAHDAAALPPEQRPHLQLSGHTHGGMFFGFRLLIERFNGGFSMGPYGVGSLKLYVSPGTGIWNGFPVRLGCPAEITLVTLTSTPQQGENP